MTDTTLLVAPAIAKTQQCPTCGKAVHVGPCAPGGVGEGTGSGSGGEKVIVMGGETAGGGSASSGPRSFTATAHLSPEFYGRDFARIGQEVLARLGDASLELTLEVRAVKPMASLPTWSERSRRTRESCIPRGGSSETA